MAMEIEAKYKIGDYVYYIDKRKGIRGGRIKSTCIKRTFAFFGEEVIYSIRGIDRNFKEDELIWRQKYFSRMK